MRIKFVHEIKLSEGMGDKVGEGMELGCAS